MGRIYPPNFELLYSDASWRSTWTHIIPGRFSSSPYTGLLFYEQSTGYAEVYETDGDGRIVATSVQTYNPLGGNGAPHWTHVVPGLFGSSGLTGILLYDQSSGYSCIFERGSDGAFIQLKNCPARRDTWTQIVPGLFTPSSNSSILFYSPSEGYGELWNTNATGLAGKAPVQKFGGWRGTWTHIVGGDFFWTPGYISSTPVFSDLFFYEAPTGYWEMYRFDETGLVPYPTASGTVMSSATNLIAGNFGGFGLCDLLLHDRSAGQLKIYSFGGDGTQLVDRETLSGLRRTFDLLAPGKFHLPNPEDRWFNDGPGGAIYAFGDEQRNWRAGTGAFSDLLLYDRAAGLGQTYLHEPLPPPAAVLDAYISSKSSHGGAAPIASGSVLPGEAISFHVTSSTPYAIRIYRQGYFAPDQTEQLVGQIGDQWPATGSLSIDRTAYRDGARWPVAVSTVVTDYPSGLYLARLQDTSSPPNTVDVPFVVRAAPDSRTKVLLVIADVTYAAYNDWGGRNVYGYATVGDTPEQRAFVGTFPSSSAAHAPYAFEVSFQRPVGYALGNSAQAWEVPMIRWLMRQGIPFDMCTARDLHFHAPTTAERNLLLFAGHHEYWTWEMRDNVESFVTAGGGVGFFCANTSWWQARISSDGGKLWCYKIAGFDPASLTAPERTTVNWWATPPGRPETDMTGVSYAGSSIGIPDGIPYIVKNAAHWALQGTLLTEGQPFGTFDDGQSVIGGECDRIQDPGPNGMRSPPGYTIASGYDPRDGNETATMGSLTKGGGEIFNAATIEWSLGLTQNEGIENVMDQITLNVISRLGLRQKPWTSVSEGQSTPGAPVTAVTLSRDRIALFLADPDGEIYTTSGSADAGWAPWTSVSEGQSTPGAPIAVVTVGQDRVALFLADPDGGIYTTSGSADAGWAPWSSVSEGQSTPGAPIAAVPIGQDRIALFLADPEGGIYTTSGSAEVGWAPWSTVSQGQSTPGAPFAALVTAPNRVALFLADPSGGIYTTSGSAETGWAPWSTVSEGRSTPGAPVTALVVAPNRIALFLADPSGGIYTTSGSAETGWAPWSTVSEGRSTPGAPVTAVLTGLNRVAVFLSDPEGGIFTTSGSVETGWAPWTSISLNGRTTPGAPVTAAMIGQDRVALFLADPTGKIYTSNP
jgi:hypothetical protein